MAITNKVLTKRGNAAAQATMARDRSQRIKTALISRIADVRQLKAPKRMAGKGSSGGSG